VSAVGRRGFYFAGKLAEFRRRVRRDPAAERPRRPAAEPAGPATRPTRRPGSPRPPSMLVGREYSGDGGGRALTSANAAFAPGGGTGVAKKKIEQLMDVELRSADEIMTDR